MPEIGCPACGAADCTPDTCPGQAEWHLRAEPVEVSSTADSTRTHSDRAVSHDV